MRESEPLHSAAGRAIAVAAALFVLATVWSPTLLGAQETGTRSTPQRVDSVLVEGNQRVPTSVVTTTFGIQVGSEVTFRDIQRGIKNLAATGQFKNVTVRARGRANAAVLIVQVEEEPLIRRVELNGLEHVSAKTVRDTTGVKPGVPYNAQHVMDAKAFIRAELAKDGIAFASIDDHLVPVEGQNNEVDFVMDVTEGNRVTVAQVDFTGNQKLPDGALEDAMDTKPEGFWWFRSGSYSDSRFKEDLSDRLPALYRSRGYLDFKVLNDTVIVDPQTGKADVQVSVDEGPQYRLRSFSVRGNSRFSTDELEAYYQRGQGGLLQSLGLRGSGSSGQEGEVFDEDAFQKALSEVQQKYANEGYLYAQVNPVIQRHPATDSTPPTVDASWQIQEGAPAIINRVSIVGNDYTYDWVIRDRLTVLPGDVYSQDRVIRSWQSISSLGFFETPMSPPDIHPLDNGDVDITFHVKEKQTGSLNFGTSVGGGVGLSGFIGYDQPNLFGQAKSGSLRWDYGRYLNSFEMSYSDPALFQSLISGTVSLFNSRDRFYQFTTGYRKRIGASVRFGVPWPNSRWTRLFVGYSLSRTRYLEFADATDTSLFGRPPGVQSQVSVGVTRQTLDHPIFPTTGSKQSVNVEFNGGLLGGNGNFTRVLTEATWWVPVGQLGGSQGGHPVRLALGLSTKAGAVFGNADAFPFDRFWMGGVQFGQPLRGYDETSITPYGYFPQKSSGIADINRIGNAYFSMTAEYAMRLTDQISISAFYDAGNVWRKPAEIDPTRLYRGAGFGLQLVTPFGPIGLDYAYGFDKTVPGWQLHFRMGPGY
ncbi:MAG: outer membrane protein assembly factor BamA [Gemmatimonadetes bacterium]|nr:outer membrane protein assembly factor BamA [Gemmatimonadota bacterium]